MTMHTSELTYACRMLLAAAAIGAANTVAASPLAQTIYEIRGNIFEVIDDARIMPADIREDVPYSITLSFGYADRDDDPSSVGTYQYDDIPSLMIEARVGSHTIKRRSSLESEDLIRIFPVTYSRDNPRAWFNMGNNIDDYVPWDDTPSLLTRWMGVDFNAVPSIRTDRVEDLPDFSKVSIGDSSFCRIIFESPERPTTGSLFTGDMKSVRRIPEPTT